MEVIQLAGGDDVPKACVDALDEFEKTWPGATSPMARAGIVLAVLKAYQKEMKSPSRCGRCTAEDQLKYGKDLFHETSEHDRWVAYRKRVSEDG